MSSNQNQNLPPPNTPPQWGYPPPHSPVYSQQPGGYYYPHGNVPPQSYPYQGAFYQQPQQGFPSHPPPDQTPSIPQRSSSKTKKIILAVVIVIVGVVIVSVISRSVSSSGGSEEDGKKGSGDSSSGEKIRPNQPESRKDNVPP